MSAPVATIIANAPIYEALLRMQERDVDHLAVMDEAGKLIGAVHLRDLARYQQSSSVIITDSIRRARSHRRHHRGSRPSARAWSRPSSTPAPTRATSTASCRVSPTPWCSVWSRWPSSKLGPPPVRFAFLALGSEGREEQTLLTDQDNALLYDDPEPEQSKEVAEYFLNMGTLVCDWLDQVGYALLRGRHHGQEPAVEPAAGGLAPAVLPLDPQRRSRRSSWSSTCSSTSAASTASSSSPATCAAWVFDQMEEYPLFFLHFAQNALLYKPPLTWSGNLQTTSSGDGAKTLSLKEALMPIVNFSRLYALRHRIDATNTLDRLSELYEKGVLSRETLRADGARLRDPDAHPAAPAGGGHREGRKPSNLITPDELTSAEEARLKRLFSLSADLRKKISYDFLGGIAGF